MRIFLTGATGYIGGALAHGLRERGHEVTALVRPESDGKALRDRGVTIVAGGLDSLSQLSDTLAGHDAFVHAAFAQSAGTVALDRKTVEILSAQNGFFVFTSGVWVLGNTKGRSADEVTPVNPIALVAWRPEHERIALKGGRAAVIRPGCAYGGKQSMMAAWFAAADQNRPLEIVGDGNNHWALVNLHDLADCYARVIEQRATGTFHAVDDSRSTLNECARAIAPKGKLQHIPADVARQKMGAFADALLLDQTITSDATRRRLGWSPRRTFVNSIDEQWREFRRQA